MASQEDKGLKKAAGVSSRKNMARKAFRQALRESPEETYSAIEKLMLKDLLSRSLGPGMPKPVLCARAWLENRSRDAKAGSVCTCLARESEQVDPLPCSHQDSTPCRKTKPKAPEPP